MRRRIIRSAAFPLHRHSPLQLAVDGALVALAYYLAFQLRFDNGPSGYYAHLRDRTIWWVVAVAVVRPVEHATSHGTSAINLPNGVIVLFALLVLVFLVGVRVVVRSSYERRPLAAFRGGRKGERIVLIAGAGDG